MKWKKILLACLTFVFVFGGVFGFYRNVWAQDSSPLGTEALADLQMANVAASQGNAATAAAFTGSAANTVGTGSGTAQSGFSLSSCGSFLSGDWFPVDCWAAWGSYYLLLTPASWLSGVSGLVFDKTIDITILQMKNNFEGNKVFIEKAWTIMRDVVNIMFLFVLLWAGIMTIISGFESGTSKKVATVIVVALLINFSMLFTKVVIDASNIVAVEFYNAISVNGGDKDWQGIAGVFMKNLQIQTLFDTVNSISSDQSKFLEIIFISLGGTLILLVLAIILFIASIMFLARYIILIILIVASSAAIGSWILPSLKKSIFDKWWSALIGQSFFAPVFIFFIYLTLLITSALSASIIGGNYSWRTLFVGTGTSWNPTDSVGLIINFLVVIGFLIGSIVVSKTLSNMAGSGAGKLNSVIGGAAIGGAAWAGRNVLGRASRKLADTSIVNDLAARSSLGRGLRSALKSGAKSSFDLRASSKAAALIGATGVDLGSAGGKGGYGAKLDEQIKNREKFYKEIGSQTQAEKMKKDALQTKIDKLEETEKRNKLIKEIKEGEEELKLLSKDSDQYKKAEGELEEKKRQAGELKVKIEEKSADWKKEIKEIDKAGKERSSAYLESLDKIIPKIPFTQKSVPKLWVGQKNKLASINIRNSKRKEETDAEKTISALKELQKEIKESKK